MENKILPLMTDEQKKQITKEVMNQYRGKVLTLGLIVAFITCFASTYAVITEKESDRLKEKIRNHDRIDSVLGTDLIGNSYYKK